jgi:hypothetical protein
MGHAAARTHHRSSGVKAECSQLRPPPARPPGRRACSSRYHTQDRPIAACIRKHEVLRGLTRAPVSATWRSRRTSPSSRGRRKIAIGGRIFVTARQRNREADGGISRTVRLGPLRAERATRQATGLCAADMGKSFSDNLSPMRSREPLPSQTQKRSLGMMLAIRVRSTPRCDVEMGVAEQMQVQRRNDQTKRPSTA